MTVRELILLLERLPADLNVAVGQYRGPYNSIGWNETHESSHGPIWVALQDGRCFIGINCCGYEGKNSSYRTFKDGRILTVEKYYGARRISP